MTQKQALNILKLGKNVFLTGAAGSGKTYVLNNYIRYLKKHHIPVAITASTGIAATHMQGRTIHSWARIGIKESLSQADLEALFKKREHREAIAEAKVLIIDEVSMLHHYRLDMVDAVLRKMHGKDEPFGGIQVILCGDLFQLPPVSRGIRAQYVCDAMVWQEMDIQICYLTEQHRHDDDELSQLLNEMRSGEVSEQSLERLLQRQHAKLASGIPTKLYTHNADVDTINLQELRRLTGKSKVFTMTHRGDRQLAKGLIDSCLAPEQLELKVGALVMFVQNNFSKGYVNGTLGVVVGFDGDGMPQIETHDGRVILASEASWRIEDGTEVVAEINQLPLRFAWAITIHKSQGMTLDAAHIDLRRSFIPGMGYVALSRVRKLETLSLEGINDRAIQVDPKVIELDHELRQQSNLSVASLKKYAAEELARMQQAYVDNLTYSGQLFAA